MCIWFVGEGEERTDRRTPHTHTHNIHSHRQHIQHTIKSNTNPPNKNKQAIPPFARTTLLPLFGPHATQRLVRAALDIRADTGGGVFFHNNNNSSSGAGAGGGGGGLDEGVMGAAAVVRPLRDAVMQALASLPGDEGASGLGEEEGEGEGELRPPRIRLEFVGPVAGAGGWWASLGGE